MLESYFISCLRTSNRLTITKKNILYLWFLVSCHFVQYFSSVVMKELFTFHVWHRLWSSPLSRFFRRDGLLHFQESSGPFHCFPQDILIIILPIFLSFRKASPFPFAPFVISRPLNSPQCSSRHLRPSPFPLTAAVPHPHMVVPSCRFKWSVTLCSYRYYYVHYISFCRLFLDITGFRRIPFSCRCYDHLSS